jgi:hypothetical protein
VPETKIINRVPKGARPIGRPFVVYCGRCVFDKGYDFRELVLKVAKENGRGRADYLVIGDHAVFEDEDCSHLYYPVQAYKRR